MSEVTLVLRPQSRRDDLFAWAARAGWTVREQWPRTFDQIGGLAWHTPAGQTVAYLEAHPFGCRVLTFDDTPELHMALAGAVGCFERADLLALLREAALEQRAFALRALVLLEQRAPSPELLDALTQAAHDPNRYVRSMALNLCWYGALAEHLAPLIARRAEDDPDLGTAWTELRERE